MYLTDCFPWLSEPTLPAMIVRTLLAIICAGIIGYDRNTHSAAAGLRTHILVCIGSMLAMSTGQYAGLLYSGVDASRIGAQVVSGIGFLGAGSIIVTSRNQVKGLTTAAGLWAAGCIGLAIGIGFYEGAIVGTIAVVFAERMLRRISKRILAAHTRLTEDPAQEITEDRDTGALSDDR